MSKKIIIDGTVVEKRGSGASRYVTNLLRNLAKIDAGNNYRVFLREGVDLPELPKKENFHYHEVKVYSRLFWKLIQLPTLLRIYGYDLVHVTDEILPLWGVRRAVVTVHEIPKFRHKLRKNVNTYVYLSQKVNEYLFPRGLRKAQKIIAVSRSTKGDIERNYEINGGKIAVTSEAAEEVFENHFTSEDLKKCRETTTAGSRYILSFATGDSRENNRIILEAYNKIDRNLRKEVKLVFAGCKSPVTKDNLETLAKKFEIEDSIKFLEYIDDQSLAKLYSAAEVYVDISLYEGFGLQVCEAMTCGVPVITSNVASLPEVVGDAGVLVDPRDAEGLASAMARVSTDSELRDLMRQKSLERARFFSWDKTARETLEIYNELLLQEY